MLVAGILGGMSEDDAAGNMRVVSDDAGGGAAFLAVGTADLAEVPAENSDCHVITLRGADGWSLVHPAQCPIPAVCAVEEAAGRISQAVCAAGGRWTCGADAGGLTLLEQIGD